MLIFPTKVREETKWCLDLRVEGMGRRFFPTRRAAESEGEQVIAEIRDNGSIFARLSPAEKAEWVRIWAEMEDKGVTIREVWEHYQHCKISPVKKTLEEVFGELMIAKRAAGRRESTCSALEYYLGRFIKGREKKQITSIHSTDIERWFHESNEAPVTIQSNLGRLSSLFQFAYRRGYVTENPCWRVERPSFDQKAPTILTVPQCAALLKFAREEKPQMLAWLSLCLFAGLRPQAEADKLPWSAVDLINNRLTIDAAGTKTRSHRIVDLNLSPPAALWLRLARKIKSRVKVPYATRRTWMREMSKAAKIKRWPQDVLRHTCASMLYAIHQDAGKVAAFLGNSPAVLMKNYRALVPREDAEKFFALMP